ncbi:hypothetical protein, partial [Bacillus pumilus]
MKKVGEEGLMEMGIGIMVFNDEYYMEWRNAFVGSCFDERRVVGR